MPAQDSTGPTGEGPKTGRGMGPCVNDGTNAQVPFSSGRGQGLRFRRFGRGCGMGCGFACAMPSLEEQESALEQQLADVRKELKAQKK